MVAVGRRRYQRPGSRGLTLIEVLITLVILLLVAAGISRLLASSWESQLSITGQNEAQKWAQRAVDTVVDSLRGASSVTAGEPARVTASFTNDNTITYYLHQGELRRDRYDHTTGQTTSGEVVCRGVSGLTLRYYVRAGDSLVEAASPLLAQSLRVSATVRSGKGQATETSLVRFRNKL